MERNTPLPNEVVERGRGLGQRLLLERQKAIEWRKARQSPPKCLDCGSTDILRDKDVGILIPQRGRVRIKGAGWCSTAYHRQAFTPEGDRIPN